MANSIAMNKTSWKYAAELWRMAWVRGTAWVQRIGCLSVGHGKGSGLGPAARLGCGAWPEFAEWLGE
eukprot:gene12327-14558_t